MKIKYTGNADVQELGSADFKKVGVDAPDYRFPNGEAVEVTDEVGKVLTEAEPGSVFDGFSFEVATGDESQPYSEWDYADLKAEANKRGLDTKDQKSATLIKALESDDEKSTDADPVQVQANAGAEAGTEGTANPTPGDGPISTGRGSSTGGDVT